MAVAPSPTTKRAHKELWPGKADAYLSSVSVLFIMRASPKCLAPSAPMSCSRL
jgi:hypothetical protein